MRDAPDYAVVEAKPYHVGRILRRVRAEHAAAMVALGLTHRELARVFRDSLAFRRAVLLEGHVVALFGVVGSAASSEGHVWLLLATEATRYPAAVLRETKAQLAEMLTTRRKLSTTLLEGDAAAFRFARHLGFRAAALPAGGMQRMVLWRDEPRPAIAAAADEAVAPFMVFALPRSRTAWLAQYLSYGDVRWAIHDAMLEAAGVHGLRKLLDRPGMGIVETGLAFALPALRRYFPQSRIAVVRRSMEEVRQSLAQHQWHYAEGHLEWLSRCLDDAAKIPGALSLDYAELATEDGARRIFEHCLGLPFDHAWWTYWDAQNVQIDMVQRRYRLAQRHAAIEELVGECSDLMEPVVIQSEAWEPVARDGAHLFEEHREEVGPLDGVPFDPDLLRAAELARAGRLHITTARAGRKLVGYLFFLVGEHPEGKETLQAVQGPFFVTRAFRGIGPRLHRAAIAALREKGIATLSMSAGARGSGPKLAHLYRRLGAVEERRVYGLRIA